MDLWGSKACPLLLVGVLVGTPMLEGYLGPSSKVKAMEPDLTIASRWIFSRNISLLSKAKYMFQDVHHRVVSNKCSLIEGWEITEVCSHSGENKPMRCQLGKQDWGEKKMSRRMMHRIGYSTCKVLKYEKYCYLLPVNPSIDSKSIKTLQDSD